ncbi:MAG: Uncharacterized protein G01um101419_215 [Parcubacteria group bacterium Gr01-1014_19]|nr:MAG: Uncharacterized protein G01um101419_215 [Parcubacteria group bacterium Gr01-1014_19]
MKFVIKNFTGNLSDAMRSAGYHYEGADQKTKEFKFYRSVSNNLFPRFHIYGFLDKSKNLSLSIHLDQKAPVYQGSTAHSGDQFYFNNANTNYKFALFAKIRIIGEH